jgi:hypothetical protein
MFKLFSHFRLGRQLGKPASAHKDRGKRNANPRLTGLTNPGLTNPGLTNPGLEGLEEQDLDCTETLNGTLKCSFSDSSGIEEKKLGRFIRKN